MPPSRTDRTIIVHDPIDYDVGDYVKSDVEKMEVAYTALRNALHCDAYAPEVRQASIAAARLEVAARDLSYALMSVKGAPEEA